MITVLRTWGFNVTTKVSQYHGAEDEKMPDFAISRAPQGCHHVDERTKTLVVDVNCICNFAESYNNSSDASHIGASKKVDKHEQNVVSHGEHIFIPIILEVSGHIHPSFDTLISKLAEQLPQLEAKEFRREMCFAVSVALQRGNARILKGAYERLRRAQTFGSRLNF
jgi:hypothetical protein